MLPHFLFIFKTLANSTPKMNYVTRLLTPGRTVHGVVRLLDDVGEAQLTAHDRRFAYIPFVVANGAPLARMINFHVTFDLTINGVNQSFFWRLLMIDLKRIYLRWDGHHQRYGPCLPAGRSSSDSAGSVWLCLFDVFVGGEFHPGPAVVFVAFVVVIVAVVGLRIQP